MFYRRRLPHFSLTGTPIFLTWRLHGTLPREQSLGLTPMTSGAAFARMDRLLDEASIGPRCLQERALASMVVESLHYNAQVLKHYDLDAFVVMPNHVHLLLTAHVPLPKLTKSIKGVTGIRANRILGRSGPFWQEESYDRNVRKEREFCNIWRYIEENPVRAGFVRVAADYHWSSASELKQDSAARGSRPTNAT